MLLTKVEVAVRKVPVPETVRAEVEAEPETERTEVEAKVVEANWVLRAVVEARVK